MNSFVDQVTLSKKVKSDLQVHLDTSLIQLSLLGLADPQEVPENHLPYQF